jgi:hypothetical protein
MSQLDDARKKMDQWTPTSRRINMDGNQAAALGIFHQDNKRDLRWFAGISGTDSKNQPVAATVAFR